MNASVTSLVEKASSATDAEAKMSVSILSGVV